MALITTKEMFKRSIKGGYAVGAFNVNNMEIIQGIMEAAMEDTGIDVVLHLDHGTDLETCKQCIDDGFTSVMYDGSKFTFEENVELTKRVVDYAHKKGAVVEAELGTLAGIEDDVIVDNRNVIYTDTQQAALFVKETGVDFLAIVIGTSHGAYKFKGEPKLDFERLEAISGLLPETPLVLHGDSTVFPEFVAMCNKYGGEIPGAKSSPLLCVLSNRLMQAA